MTQTKLENSIARLKEHQKRLWAYKYATGIINYDSMTSMPRDSVDAMGNALEMLSGETYSIQTDSGIGELLDELMENEDALDLQTGREVRELHKRRQRLLKMPKKDVMELESAIGRATAAWEKAKECNEYKIFAPHLEELIEMRRRYAQCVNPEGNIYDTLMDDYEPDMKISEMDPFFDSLKEKLVPLILEIQKVGKPDMSCLKGEFPVDRQRELSGYMMDVMGLDHAHCTLGESTHPITTQFSKYDVRITTCYEKDNITTNLYSVIHEGGHAMYELNVDDKLAYSILGEGASMAMHESQSRLWENIIGRSHAFCQMMLPKLQELFPEKFESVQVEELYRAINMAEPSLIRVDADELTYPIHVLIRYEIEKAIFAGDLKVKDIPAAWNELYEKYLGLKVPDYSSGVLQDIHWAAGYFGYFPSYALGTAYSAQIFDSMSKDISLEKCCESGNLSPMRDWLTEKIYRHGMIYTPKELITSTCGQSFKPDYYVNYLWEKYGKLYSV